MDNNKLAQELVKISKALLSNNSKYNWTQTLGEVSRLIGNLEIAVDIVRDVYRKAEDDLSEKEKSILKDIRKRLDDSKFLAEQFQKEIKKSEDSDKW